MTAINYAIVLYMNDEKTDFVNGLISELAPVCGSNYCLNTKPRITISAIIADDENRVREEVEKLSKHLKKGNVQLVSIGAFTPWVLFLAPVVDSYLLESSQVANDYMLKFSEIGNNGRYIPGNWVPHMAVAMKMDKEGFNNAFIKLSDIFIPFSAEIDKMALIKYEEGNPYQELAVYELT